MAEGPRGPTRESLQQYCEVPPVQHSVRLQFYFNVARNTLLQGESYCSDGDLQQAYIFLKRFLTLAVKVIPSHNAFNKTVYAKDKSWLQRERKRVFDVLHAVSVQLDNDDDVISRAGVNNATDRNDTSSSSSISGDWWDDLPEAPTGAPTTKAVAKNSDRTVAKRFVPTYANPKPPKPEPSRPPQSPSHQNSTVDATHVVPSAPPAPDGYGDWEGGGCGGLDGSRDMGVRGAGSGPAAAPALADAFRTLSLDQSDPAGGYYPEVGSPRYQRDRPSLRSERSVVGVKRRMVFPTNLVEVFERIARPNTSKSPYGIETCGILAGKVTHNVLEMTTLIIPKQEGTSDSCATTDETELFNYMLANKLITLGWIHTHPMQQCFLSSVDMHTHCGYQLMLPEAVAIVYAPCDNRKRIGVFRLTQPGGMKLIQECKLKGFHVHPDNIVIYEDASLDWDPRSHMAVADLR